MTTTGLAPLRIETGIPGLDVILKGGLLRGNVFLVEGAAGTGKTVLANQIAFHHASTGGQVTYVGLLSESTSQILRHLENLRFFDRSLIGSKINYLSGYPTLNQGLQPFLEMIRQAIHAQSSSLLIIDGLLSVAEQSGPSSLRRFMHELQAHTELLQCTTLLISPSGLEGFRPEHTIADGIIWMCQQEFGLRAARTLRVVKLRGGGVLSGSHFFEIRPEGLRIYPRIESILSFPTRIPQEARELLPTGVADIDEMLRGGIRQGTSTMLLGAAGTGKTVLGLHFLAEGAARQEPVLYFGMYESPPRLLAKAESVGLPLGEHVRQNRAVILWRPPVESFLDEMAEFLLRQVREHRATRLFLDGLNAFNQVALVSGRTMSFFTALMNELRGLGVTTLLSAESASLFASEIQEPIDGFSAVVENLVLLRFVEYRASIRRVLAILKVRDGDYDPNLREYTITSDGIKLGQSFHDVEALLSGVARSRQPGAS